MKVGNFIADIQAYVNSGLRSDEVNVSPRLIYNLMNSGRSALLKAKIDQQKNQNISSINYNVLSCIQMEKVSIADCPCLNINTCKTILRSKYQLPKFLSSYWGDIIDYVTTIDGFIKFNKSSLLELNQIEYYQYQVDTTDWFIEDRYLYVKPSKKYSNLQIVRMKAIFEDITEVNKFKQLNCKSEEETIKNNVACTNYDLDFNIDDDLVDKLRELVITHIYKYHLVNINDDINNSSNDNGKNKTNFGRTTQQQPTSKE
jgi:hypothetical protein